MGQLLSFPKIQPLKLPTPPSASIDMMSVYQPFPLRVDSFGEQGKQYDACFQIGEFPGKNVNGTGIVILVPLKIDPNPGIGGQFVNAFASKIPNILGAQPDPLLGYPDVPAQTGATWDVSKVVKVDRPYYTWEQSDGTRIIVMAEPILIAQADMANIQRLPVTPPEDVIHEIGSPILYHPAPPVDARGNPVPCPPTAWSKSVSSIIQPPVVLNKPAADSNLILEVLLGIIGTLAVIIGVWFGVKMAAGPVGDRLKGLGDSIGRALAGGYETVRKATPRISLPKPAPAPPPPPPKSPATGLTVRVPRPKTEAENRLNSALNKSSPLQESLEDFKKRQTTRSPPRSPTGSPRSPTGSPRIVGGPGDSGAGTGLFGGKRKKRRRNRLRTGRKV